MTDDGTFQLSLAEQLSFSTVRIECNTPDGRSTGTGFFFRFCDDGQSHVPAIVTNKHVIENATSGQLCIHLASSAQFDPPFRFVSLPITDFSNSWIPHPDENVDLCIATIGALCQEVLAQLGQELFYIPLSRALILSEAEMVDLQGLEEILMVGYPNGLWDKHNNMPIMRRGITATHPRLDYENRKEFLIDAACFPGSSGSPILLFNQGAYMKRSGSVVAGTRLKLLGILYAGPQHTATGEIVMMGLPTSPKPMAISQIPNNLGLVVKAQRLLDFDLILQTLSEQQSS